MRAEKAVQENRIFSMASEIGEFIDIKRECAERGHQKRRGRLRSQLVQLLGLGHR
mgnify:CR=1 FL=1